MRAGKQPQLSQEELAAIRKSLEREAHIKWLITSLAIWLAWITGVAAGTLALVKVMGDWNVWFMQ